MEPFTRKVKKNRNTTTIALEATEGIANTSGLQSLYKALDCALKDTVAKTIRLDATAMEEADIAFAQVVQAAAKEANSLGKKLEVKSLAEPLAAKFSEVGVRLP